MADRRSAKTRMAKMVDKNLLVRVSHGTYRLNASCGASL